MNKLSFNREPALWAGIIGAAFSVALAFGLKLNIDQQGALSAFAFAVLALVTRQSVSPVYAPVPTPQSVPLESTTAAPIAPPVVESVNILPVVAKVAESVPVVAVPNGEFPAEPIPTFVTLRQ